MPVTKYIWDVTTDTVLMETDENDATTAVYTNAPGQFGPVISQRRGANPHFFHRDALGSVVDVTDAAESPTDSYVYKAYGELVATSGSTVNPFRWVGGVGYYYDGDLLQYYIRARHYDPRLGRFPSRDPIAYEGGDVNLYRYLGNGPVRYVDPSGRGFWDWPIWPTNWDWDWLHGPNEPRKPGKPKLPPPPPPPPPLGPRMPPPGPRKPPPGPRKPPPDKNPPRPFKDPTTGGIIMCERINKRGQAGLWPVSPFPWTLLTVGTGMRLCVACNPCGGDV